MANNLLIWLKEPTKIELLDIIYLKISKKVSSKITGMFAEAYDMEQLKSMIDDPSCLNSHVLLACETIVSHGQN